MEGVQVNIKRVPELMPEEIMRAAGMKRENLQAITAIMDQYRQMQGLPPVTDASAAEEGREE